MAKFSDDSFSYSSLELTRSAGNNKEVIDGQWKHVVDRIYQLLRDHEQHETPTTGSSIQQCSREQCQKRFNLTERRQQCCRCGLAFCKQCLTYQRRLNSRGDYDVQGQLCQVCEGCFNDGSQTIGQTRGLYSAWFLPMRSHHKIVENFPSSVSCDRLNFDKECKRICEGFLASVSKVRVGQVLKEMFGINKEEWEKSPGLVYGNIATSCFGCRKEIGSLQRRHNCTICGMLVCDGCSNSDLIVYVPDDDAGEQPTAKLAVIRIVGCPSKEPNKCRYLRICRVCSMIVQRRQVAEYELDLDRASSENNSVENLWLLIEHVNNKLWEIQKQVDINLLQYRGLVDTLGEAPSFSSVSSGCRSNMRVLAKSQGDLSDLFTKFVSEVFSMKNLKPLTNGQSRVLKKIIRAKCEYYSDKMADFRALQRQLETVVPKEILKVVQDEVDRNAMNSCYIVLKQLIYEVLLVRSKHGLELPLDTILMQLEQVAQSDLQACIVDPWPEQEQHINELIKSQLVSSKTRYLKFRNGFNNQNVILRTKAVLEKISLQLTSKVSNNSFQNSKAALKTAIADCDNLLLDSEWTFVE